MNRDVLKFSPLLLVYLFLVLILSTNTLQGDEPVYLRAASHLVQGYNLEVSQKGPGYLIILIPFVLFNLPLLAARLLNAFFLFGAVIYFYKTLNLYLDRKYAAFFALVLGLYPPFMREIQFLITESFVFFLICGFMFHFCKSLKLHEKHLYHIIAALIFLVYLALTKVFFGYVILFVLFSFLIVFIWRRTIQVKKTIYIFLFALLSCTPYLMYTYFQTGKVFYWGTSGGQQLYWMTTRYTDDEFGSWFSAKNVMEWPQLTAHRDFFENISSLSEVEQDDAFKKQALENLFRNPKNYLINWAANIGRLLFSYPFSYTQSGLTTYFYLMPNMFIVVLFILSIYPSVKKLGLIPFEILCLLYFAMVSFGGTSLLSAYDRQFRPLVPFLLLWISFVYICILKIEIRTR